MTRFYVIVALIVFAAGIGASLYWRGHRSGYAAGFAAEKSAYDKHLEADRLAQLAAQVDARRKEYQLSTAVAAAAKSYEQGKADAESAAEKTLADLRSGTVRLRQQWRGCEAAARVPATAAAAAEPDGFDRLRGTGASDLVRIVGACQAQVDGLKTALIAERSASAGAQ